MFKLILFLSLILSLNANANINYIDSLDISVGVSHVCAQTVAGIKCFGNSEDVTLKAPPNLKNPRFLNTGNRFSCVIVDDGIRCWGEIPGQTKKDILIGKNVLKKPKLLAVGYEHACGVAINDKIKCWGNNNFGESIPPLNLKNITELSLGMTNSCAIADGKVICWGMSVAGSVDVPSDLVNPRNLTSGWWHHCVETDEGIKCWGYPYKTYTPPDDPSITTFTSGGFYNCAIVTEGVKCWDDKGKTSLIENSQGAFKVSVGSNIGCAITTEKGVICWKLSSSGKYKLMKSFVPSGGISNIQYISAGNASTCAYGDVGVLKCWGFNPDGALNVPSTISGQVSAFSLGSHETCAIIDSVLTCYGDTNQDYSIPKDLGNVTMVSSGGYHVCAGSNDKLTCWGDDVRGAVTSIPKNLTNISQISSGFTHSCAVSNGEVYCWGGEGLIKHVNPSEKMMNPKAICAGGTFSCAIDSKGKISCWGEQVPFDKETFSANDVLDVPRDINDAIEISCGLTHACAIYKGKVKCWGNVGTLNLLSPKSTLKNPHMLTAGWNHTCVLSDLGLSCWGNMLNIDMPTYSLEK